jgi:hypothetical protein
MSKSIIETPGNAGFELPETRSVDQSSETPVARFDRR